MGKSWQRSGHQPGRTKFILDWNKSNYSIFLLGRLGMSRGVAQPGFSKAQADAIQAHIQALFTGVPTWLSNPRNRWPEHWSKEFWQPMVPLVLALYGHPDSGGIWENHLNSRNETTHNNIQSFHVDANCMSRNECADWKSRVPSIQSLNSKLPHVPSLCQSLFFQASVSFPW